MKIITFYGGYKGLILMRKLIYFTIAFLLISSCFIPCVYAQSFQNNSRYGRKYAVIVVGRYAGMLKDALPENFQKYYGWYLNAARMMYETLRDVYGYDGENIFLFVSLRNRYQLPDGFDSSWIDYDSNKQNLQNVLNKFKPGGEIWLDSNDSLLFCYIDHGADNSEIDGKYASNTFFGFPYEFDNLREIISYFVFKKDLDSYSLRDWELAEYLENIHAGRMIFLLQPCYSGGFINELSKINHIVCTSSRENEIATQSWIEPFIRGLGGRADANGDNKISILEAYEYAARKVNEETTREHPLIDDNDDGIGHHYTEVGYDPCNPNADGYLAARTYL